MPVLRPRFARLGGGTGTASLARGSRRYGYQVCIPTPCDDGGSSGLIIDGAATAGERFMPVGDFRQFLAALTPAETEEDINFRHTVPPFNGHSAGNIELAGLIRQHGGVQAGINRFRHKYGITDGTVIPATSDPLQLRLKLRGEIIKGESAIGDHRGEINLLTAKGGAPKLSLWPKADATLNPEAYRYLAEEADVITVGPGGWFTSIAPLMLLRGMKEALLTARARGVPIICVTNIMTRRGHTVGLCAAQHVQVLEDLLRTPIFTHAIVNRQRPSQEMLDRYAKEDEKAPVEINPDRFMGVHYEVVIDDLLSDERVEQRAGDLIQRTVLRHGPTRPSNIEMEIYLSWNRRLRAARREARR